MRSIYVETSALLYFAKVGRIAKEIENARYFVSDLVIAEIHNVDEPWRQWSSVFLSDTNFLVLKIDEDIINYSMKYVYNRVIDMKDISLGMHYAIAVDKGCDMLISCEGSLYRLKPEFDRINKHFGKKDVTVELLEGDFDEKLADVRYMISRLLEAQGSLRLYRAILESVEAFMKEKSIKLNRIQKVNGL